MPVSALGSGTAKKAPTSSCSRKIPKRCGISRRYECVDVEKPCGSNHSVRARCNRSAVGPSRRDRCAPKSPQTPEVTSPSPLRSLCEGPVRKSPVKSALRRRQPPKSTYRAGERYAVHPRRRVGRPPKAGCRTPWPTCRSCKRCWGTGARACSAIANPEAEWPGEPGAGAAATLPLLLWRPSASVCTRQLVEHCLRTVCSLW